MLSGVLLGHPIGLHEQALQHRPLRYTVTAGQALQGAFGVEIDQQTQAFELTISIFQIPRPIVSMALYITHALGLNLGVLICCHACLRLEFRCHL